MGPKFWNKSSKWVSNWLGFLVCSNGERALGEPCYFHWVPHFLGMFTRWKKLLWNVSSKFLGTSWNIYYFFILTYYCFLFPVPTSPLVTRWNWYFLKCEFNLLGTSSWNIISWGTVPGSHANPTSPSLVRALRRRVVGCRGRLRQRPSLLRSCCCISLSRSPKLRFFF